MVKAKRKLKNKKTDRHKEPDDAKEQEEKQPVYIENIYPHEYWLEKYNNQNKYQSNIFNKYLIDIKNTPLTTKFYSKYDSGAVLNNESTGQSKYIDSVTQFIQSIPNERYFKPITENHKYGWFSSNDMITTYDQADVPRFFKPIPKGELSVFAEKLILHKITERPRFTGIIFKV